MIICICINRVRTKENRSTKGCSKLKRSVDMTSSGKNCLSIRTNASPKWDKTKCPNTTAQIKWKIRSNSLENLTHYYLLTCRVVVHIIVWEIGRGKQAAGQSPAVGRVMWTKCLPLVTIQPMEATLRNSNKIICKHRKLPLHAPGKVSSELALIENFTHGKRNKQFSLLILIKTQFYAFSHSLHVFNK